MGGLEPQVMVPWLFCMCVHSLHWAEEPGGHAHLSPGSLTLYGLGQGSLSLPWFPCSKTGTGNCPYLWQLPCPLVGWSTWSIWNRAYQEDALACQNVRLGFSVISCIKTRTNFLANPILSRLIVGWYSNSMFNILRTCHLFFQSDGTILHFYQQ